jgi:hypothetical protein
MRTQPTKNTLLQAAASQPTNQSLQESIFSPTQEKLKNKKSPTVQKNKTSQTHNPQKTDTNIHGIHLTAIHLRTMHSDMDDRTPACNMGFANMAGTVCKSTIVHLINFSAGGQFSAFNPPHRKAPKRYQP